VTAWTGTLIFCTVLFSSLKAVFPKGEKSPLYSSLKFLLSLIVTLVLFSPILPLFGKNISIDGDFFQISETENTADNAKEILLQKTKEQITDAAKKAFPDTEFSIEILSSGEKIPTGIILHCTDGEKGEVIREFLQENFSILTTLKTKEE
jgi:hypothetical protein